MRNITSRSKQHVLRAAIAISAVLIGAAVAYYSIYIIGFWAGSDLTLPKEYIELEAMLITSVPPIALSAIAGILISAISKHRASDSIIAYLSAVATFIIIMKPWEEVAPGISIGVAGYWSTYAQFLALPLTAWIIARKVK